MNKLVIGLFLFSLSITANDNASTQPLQEAAKILRGFLARNPLPIGAYEPSQTVKEFTDQTMQTTSISYSEKEVQTEGHSTTITELMLISGSVIVVGSLCYIVYEKYYKQPEKTALKHSDIMQAYASLIVQVKPAEQTVVATPIEIKIEVQQKQPESNIAAMLVRLYSLYKRF